MKTYNNRWISDAVLESLSECSGRILDLGGGLAPYYRADVIVDIAPYDPDRLADNAWPLTKSRKFKVESEKKEAKHPASLHLTLFTLLRLGLRRSTSSSTLPARSCRLPTGNLIWGCAATCWRISRIPSLLLKS